MSSTEMGNQPLEANRTSSRPSLFPVLWPLLLGIICAVVWNNTDDQGLANTMIHFAVVLTVIGWSIWIVLRSGWSGVTRYAAAGVMLLLLSSVYFQFGPIELITNGDVGVTGWRWRWSDPDRNLAAETIKLDEDETDELQTTEFDYPGFLGLGFWAEVSNVQLAADWEAEPPKEIWRQRIGAGWSAFAVVDNLVFTQEQRGDKEMVTCYALDTGDLVWSHADDARFDPKGGGSLGGVGPQATPTVHNGRVFTHGATGIINCLDADCGKPIWSHNAEEEFGVETLLWGKSASPLIVGDLVVISIGDAAANIGEEFSDSGNSLVAFDQATGDIIWQAGDRRSSYATPVLATIGGVEQVVVVNEDYVTSHRAEDGKILWEHPWLGRSDSNASTSQPIPVAGDRVYLSKGYGIGSEFIQVIRTDDKWETKTLWKKPVMKTKMGNVVLRDGYVYGLNEVNLMCIELETGKKKWIKRRSPSLGHGQLMLVGDKLLILSEEGEVVLVAADPKGYEELASFPAIEGITWNNPTLTGPRFLVRNAEWAACFELPVVAAPVVPTTSAE